MDDPTFGDIETLNKLMAEHDQLRFPKGLAGTAVETIDLVMLDADIFGCAQTFLIRNYALDPWRLSILGLCYGKVITVCRSLTGEPQAYFVRLEKIARLTLEAVVVRSPRDDED